MKKVFLPYNFLLIIGILALLISFIIPADTISFTFSFTTLLISSSLYLQLCSFFFFLLSAGNRLSQHYFRFKILIWLHIIFSISLPAIIYWSSYQFRKYLALIELSNDDELSYVHHHEKKIYFLISLLVAIQILAVINLLLGVFYKRKNISNNRYITKDRH